MASETHARAPEVKEEKCFIEQRGRARKATPQTERRLSSPGKEEAPTSLEGELLWIFYGKLMVSIDNCWWGEIENGKKKIRD